MSVYYYDRNHVKVKTRILGKSDEELKSAIAKKWKLANSVEEAKQRALKAYEIFQKTDHTLNAVYSVYKKFPELLLFKDIIENVTNLYEHSHINMYSKADEQLSNFDSSIARLSTFTKKLYSNLLDKAQNQPTQEPAEVKPVQKRKYVLKRKILTSTLREACKDDTTPLQNLFDAQSLAEMEPLFTYLATKQLKTVGDFMRSSEDEKKRHTLYIYFISHFEAAYNKFNDRIVEYAKDKYAATSNAEIIKDRYIETHTKEIDKDKNIATSTTEIDRDKFYETLRNTPAESFEKGCAAMEEIAEQYRKILVQLTNKCITPDGSQQEIQEIVERENAIYQPIVAAKRQELADVKHKEELQGFAKSIIDDSVKFHHKNQDFNNEERHVKKHSPEGRNL